MEVSVVSPAASLFTAELPQFVYKLNDKYVCPVCKLVLRNAMQLPCGHQICELCIDMLFGESDNATCPVKDDEECEQPFPKNQVNKLLLFVYTYKKMRYFQIYNYSCATPSII